MEYAFKEGEHNRIEQDHSRWNKPENEPGESDLRALGKGVSARRHLGQAVKDQRN